MALYSCHLLRPARRTASLASAWADSRWTLTFSLLSFVSNMSSFSRLFSQVIQKASGITLRCDHLFTLGRLRGYGPHHVNFTRTMWVGSLPRTLVHLNTSSHLEKGFLDHPRCRWQSTLARLYDLRMSCSWWDARRCRGAQKYRGIITRLLAKKTDSNAER